MSPCLHFTWLSPCLHFHKAPVISIEYRWVVHQSEHELVIRDSKQGVRSKENREREREREWRTVWHPRLTSSVLSDKQMRTQWREGEKEERKREKWLTSEWGWRQTKRRCSCASLWAWLRCNNLHWHRWRERDKVGGKEGEWWEEEMKRTTGGLTQNAILAL